MIELTDKAIDYTALTESVRSNQAGAVLLFLGTVREMTGERQTTSLDYEAYPEMAIAKMEEIAEQAKQQWPIKGVAIVHRLGHLELGDVSIAIAVSCSHRDQAYAAGRFLIDTLKQVVPIWKKEHWANGTTEWVHPGVAECSSRSEPEGGKEGRREGEKNPRVELKIVEAESLAYSSSPSRHQPPPS